MKKLIALQILLLVTTSLLAQKKVNCSIFENVSKKIENKMHSNTELKNISLRTMRMSQNQSKKESAEKYTPTFSLDILDGSGLHLFTTPNLGPIPSFKVGAKINAGIKISI